jgi:heme/copper-type cytochrome/quinol oxidase subunit 2
MQLLDNLNVGGNRLLDTTSSLILPVNIPIRFLVTSSDVIHS